MKLSSTQKVIKIGDSVAVTIPSKIKQQLALEPGAQVKVSFEAPAASKQEPSNSALEQYAQFKLRYGATLQNLADR